MAPQHGRIFTGDNIHKFLNWFEELDVGVAIPKTTEESANALEETSTI